MGSLRTTFVYEVVKVTFVFLLVVAQLDGVASAAGGTTTARKERRPAGPSGGTKSSPSVGSTSSGSSSTSGAASEFSADDFHDLTDKLTQKLMKDIDKYKAEDPNWGKPPPVDEHGDDEEMDRPPKTECDFECPKGKIPEPNPDFKMPKFKNCKDYDRSWDRIPGASQCCARHQKCYHTCLRERPLCDQEFGACMEGICEDLKEKGRIGSEDIVKACQAAMGLLGMIVMEPGCKMYPEAQSAACNCVKPVSTGSNKPVGSAGTVTGSDKKKKQKQRSAEKSDDDSCSIDEPACDGEERTAGENGENVQQKSQKEKDIGGDKKSGSKPHVQDEDIVIDLTKDEL